MFQQRKTLLFPASKTVFFQYLNTVCVFNAEGYYYCSCDSLSRYKNYAGHGGYCVICRINDTYYSYDFERVKYQPVELVRLASEFLDDLRLCCKFDKTLNFWIKDYECKWRDIFSGETDGIYLKDSGYSWKKVIQYDNHVN